MMKHLQPTVLRFITINLLLFIFFGVKGQQQEVVIDKIIVKVDNYIILKSDLEKAYLDYLSRGELNTGNLKCQILENLVVNKMMVAKAEIDSVVILEAEVNSSLQRRMDYMISQIGSQEEIEKFYGKSIRQIENELFDDVKEQLTIQKMQGEITSGLKVTPSEVKRFFNDIPRDSLPYFSTEVSVAQIVLEPKPSKKQLDKVEKQLSDIRNQIVNGADFANLARLYSEDPGSASRGGQLPFYKRGELAPQFEAAAMTMAAGELSKPIKTDFGYHLIEMQEKRGNTFKSRHILLIPKPATEDVDKAERDLDSIRTLIVNDSIKFRSAAKEFSDDKMTSSNGGFFTDQSGSSKVSVETLDPNVFFTVDTMKIGSITRPLKFTQPDGSTAFRILYYQDKISPHQANLDDDYQKIAAATLNEKSSRLINEWFNKARMDIYIDVDPEYNYCDLLK